MDIFIFCISAVAAYLIGSFPTSYLITKYTRGIDIRTAGSGNAGATNVFRVAGKIPAIATLLIDILKGVFVVTVVFRLSYYPYLSDVLQKDFYIGFLALTVIAGHIWSIFLKFKGGKGVATTLGVAIAVTPQALIPSFIIWAVVFFTLNYMSLASVIALISFPVAVIFVNYSFYTVLFAVIICGIGIYKHKDNIKRLLQGEERKIILFKKKKGIQKS